MQNKENAENEKCNIRFIEVGWVIITVNLEWKKSWWNKLLFWGTSTNQARDL